MNFDKLLLTAERYRQADNPNKALNLFEQAAELQENDPDVHTGMGWCYIDLERPDVAIHEFNVALRNAPRLSDAYMGLAESYRMKQNKIEALHNYKKYLEILPNGPDARVAKRMIKMLQN